MAHLWIKNSSGEWAALPLEADAYALGRDVPLPLHRADEERDAVDAPSVVLMRQEQHANSWILIARADASLAVNGRPVRCGIRAIADRDEVRVGETTAHFFTTETLAAVETLTGSDKKIFCPRCKQEVEKDTPSVRCPQCRLWHHQTQELPCWTYAETCALCPQATDLGAGFRWTPDEL